MGVDSVLVNTRTQEYLDVRGFWRYTLGELRTALGSRETLRKIVLHYTDRPEATDAYRDWLTDLLLDFAARGGATLEEIELCHDNDFETLLSWFTVIERFQCIGSVNDFNSEHPEWRYR